MLAHRMAGFAMSPHTGDNVAHKECYHQNERACCPGHDGRKFRAGECKGKSGEEGDKPGAKEDDEKWPGDSPTFSAQFHGYPL